jgi:hypothetical protein
LLQTSGLTLMCAAPRSCSHHCGMSAHADDHTCPFNSVSTPSPMPAPTSPASTLARVLFSRSSHDVAEGVTRLIVAGAAEALLARVGTLCGPLISLLQQLMSEAPSSQSIDRVCAALGCLGTIIRFCDNVRTKVRFDQFGHGHVFALLFASLRPSLQPLPCLVRATL